MGRCPFHIFTTANDKTFFMVAYEYLQLKARQLPYSTLVPTTSGGVAGKGMAGGDFSSLCGTSPTPSRRLHLRQYQIYDPTSVASGTGKQHALTGDIAIPTGKNQRSWRGLPRASSQRPTAALSPAGTVNYISSRTPRNPNHYFSFVTRDGPRVLGARQHFDMPRSSRLTCISCEPNEGFPAVIGPIGLRLHRLPQ